MRGTWGTRPLVLEVNRMLSELSAVKCLPWEGEYYKEGIKGKKVLILGESHYHNCEKKGDRCNKLTPSQRHHRHRRLTIEVVEWWKDNPHKSPVSHAVPKLFEIGRYDFWGRVSFYNYVQRFVLAPRDRPAEEDWEKSTKAFQQVLDCLQPDRV